MKNDKCQVIFFGTPGLAVPTLEALNKTSARGGQGFLSIKAVVTQPDKPTGRHRSTLIPSPIKQAAKALKLPVLEELDGLKGIEADLGVVVAFGEILPKWVLDRFPLGILNIHPSLLPKYRGPSPIQAAILNRDKETGVSIIKLDDQMDHGPIVTQAAVRLADDETTGELYDLLFKKGAGLLIKILPDYIVGKIELQRQDDSQATYTKKLTKADGQINWSKSSQEIEAHIRAMNPWPGAWTMWQGKRLIVWRVKSGVELEEVQLAGKKKMAFTEFCKGHPDFSIRG